MTAHVISHRRPTRKSRGHGRARVRFTRRLGAVLVTLAALALASWLALQARQAMAPLAPTAAPAMLMPPTAALAPAADMIVNPQPVRVTHRRPSSVPLNAAHAAAEPDGFEVLNAQELAAISQAGGVE